ncbi:MAG: carboxymuconolactone decarboxylase family protein [Methanomassiliicoccaceae archaeon]|jgi:alkylhydroperoxidase/carboxymuconolactone decarboxylase family protein YurZ|nr:carboxymuconolactone decarboxylase family protein [Methanomassiliicoccaceae archaeon]
MKVSRSFETFGREAPEVRQAWMEMVQKADSASKLDKKTEELAYIAVLAAVRSESGLPFHVKMAKAKGATRDEVISAVLVGLPAVGSCVVSALPIALDAFDEKD